MSFCTSCGKPLDEGARFCTGCGNPAEAPASVQPTAAVTVQESPAAAAAAPALQSVAPPPATAQAAPPPVTKSALPTVLVVVGIIFLLIVGAAVAGTIYVKRQIRAKLEAVQSEIQRTGFKSPEAQAHPAPAEQPAPTSNDSSTAMLKAMNLGNYPGATAMAATVESGQTVVAAFQTRDTPEQVIGYYKVRFPVSESSADAQKGELTAALPTGGHMKIDAEAVAGMTEVKILQEP